VSALFELEGVEVRRGGRVALARLSAAIGRGTTCVTGPSGAGKSTLLRLLNRLRDPDAGVVRFDGRDVRELDALELRRTVALVPQLPALLDGDVRDCVASGPRLAGRPDPDVERLLGLAELPAAFAARPASGLSVGEQQRVMLARALALEPAVLLLDEPTSALDERARDAIETTLRRLRDEVGVALVFVTHDPAQAARLGDERLVLTPAAEP
jgi:putative ABC transport system ATP-binding protein